MTSDAQDIRLKLNELDEIGGPTKRKTIPWVRKYIAGPGETQPRRGHSVLLHNLSPEELFNRAEKFSKKAMSSGDAISVQYTADRLVIVLNDSFDHNGVIMVGKPDSTQFRGELIAAYVPYEHRIDRQFN